MIRKVGIFFVLRCLYTNKEEAIILQMTTTTAIYSKFYKGNTLHRMRDRNVRGQPSVECPGTSSINKQSKYTL